MRLRNCQIQGEEWLPTLRRRKRRKRRRGEQ